jgi:Tfp pilus assembly protein PilN
MYTIDLLQGEGVPIRSRPGSIAFACLLLAVPLLTAIGVVTFSTDCDVVIAIQKQQLSKLEAGIETLSAAVERKEALERDRDATAALLSGVSTALEAHTQWSPVLSELVENLSDTLILTKLEIRRETLRRKVPAEGDPTHRIEISVPVRTLKIRVCGPDREGCHDAVKDLEERLRGATRIGSMLETMIVSREADRLDGVEAVAYELDCRFKPMIQ